MIFIPIEPLEPQVADLSSISFDRSTYMTIEQELEAVREDHRQFGRYLRKLLGEDDFNLLLRNYLKSDEGRS